jgi:hypothetical protein
LALDRDCRWDYLLLLLLLLLYPHGASCKVATQRAPTRAHTDRRRRRLNLPYLLTRCHGKTNTLSRPSIRNTTTLFR